MGHTPSTAGTFRKKFRKNSGKTPERSQSVSWNFPRENGRDAPMVMEFPAVLGVFLT